MVKISLKEIERQVLRQMPEFKENGEMEVIFGEYVDQYFTVYVIDEDKIEVEYNYKQKVVPCSIYGSSKGIAACIMGAFKELYESRTGEKQAPVETMGESRVNGKREISLTESQFNGLVKKMVRETVSRIVESRRIDEVMGWSLEPGDFVYVDGEPEDGRKYSLVKIPNCHGGIIMTPYIVEYNGDVEEMLERIKEFDSSNNSFVPRKEYDDYVREIMEDDGLDEEEAERYADDCYVCINDFAIYVPYGMYVGEPMDGGKIRSAISKTGEDNWLKH